MFKGKSAERPRVPPAEGDGKPGGPAS